MEISIESKHHSDSILMNPDTIDDDNNDEETN